MKGRRLTHTRYYWACDPQNARVYRVRYSQRSRFHRSQEEPSRIIVSTGQMQDWVFTSPKAARAWGIQWLERHRDWTEEMLFRMRRRSK